MPSITWALRPLSAAKLLAAKEKRCACVMSGLTLRSESTPMTSTAKAPNKEKAPMNGLMRNTKPRKIRPMGASRSATMVGEVMKLRIARRSPRACRAPGKRCRLAWKLAEKTRRLMASAKRTEAPAITRARAHSRKLEANSAPTRMKVTMRSVSLLRALSTGP